MIKFRHFAKISSNIFHIICQNLIRQFLKVTFNEIFCQLVLFLFYGTPAYYIASGNSYWLLWPKCWLETEFDNRLRLRFSLLIQLILGKCAKKRMKWNQPVRLAPRELAVRFSNKISWLRSLQVQHRIIWRSANEKQKQASKKIVECYHDDSSH